MSAPARLGALCCLFPALALAGPKTLVVATGNCRDPELTDAMLSFSAALHQRLGADALDPQAVLDRFRPRPSMSLDELKLLLDAAQTQYWAVEHQKAGRSVEQAMAELEKVSPLARPWKLMAFALVMDGLVHRNLGHKLEMQEAWRRVLRVEPGHKLDPDLYSPSVRAQFDQLRKDLAAGKKFTLTVTTLQPGAEVFIEGAPVGKTPYAERFPPGRYRVSVARGDRVSFGHLVKLEEDITQVIDLELEATLGHRSPLCIESDGSTPNALRLAALTGTDAVVVFRLESRNAEPGWANAVLVDLRGGARVREGGLKTSGAAKHGLAELADFVVTGTASSAVVPISASAAVGTPGPPSSAVTSTPLPIQAASPSPSGSPNRLRVAGYAVGGAGLAAMAAGGAAWLAGAGDRARLGELTGPSRSLPAVGTPEYYEAIRLVNTADANASLSTGLAVAGGIAVACGFGVVVLSGRSGPDEAAVVVVPQGDGLGVAGRF